jgi:hypothetical protein
MQKYLKVNKRGWLQWLTSVILATWETEISRLRGRSQPRYTVHETPISKITRAKWSVGVAQVVEHLLCKPKPWVQNPIPPPKKFIKESEEPLEGIAS